MIFLQGIVVPMLTPLTDRGELDRPAAGRLAERLLRGGVRGVFVGGTTGEFLALPTPVRAASFGAAAEAARGAATLIAGIGACCRQDTVRLAEEAARAGFDAVALLPPPFFPLTPTELEAFLIPLIEELPLPVVLYNIPAFAGSAIEVPTAAALARHPRVIGIKDSSGEAAIMHRLLEECQSPDFKVLVGNDVMMVEALLGGADGAVPGFGNLVPELYVELYRAAREGDADAARETWTRIGAVHGRCRAEAGNSWLATVAWLKKELHRAGVCQPCLAPLFAAPHAPPRHCPPPTESLGLGHAPQSHA